MRSLRATLTWWHGGSLVSMYLLGAAVIWLLAWSDARRDLTTAVVSEAEGVGASLASVPPSEVSELGALVADPVPVWVRLLAGGEPVAAAPGFPQRRSGSSPGDARKRVESWLGADGGRYLSVYEAVAGHPGWRVEATASLSAAQAHLRRLAWALSFAGLVLLPLVALVSRHLARWGLGPLARLVERVRGFDDSSLEGRLELDGQVPEELHALTSEFNALLARIEQTVEASHRFMTDASHELRNPLSVLRTGLEVTLRRPRRAEEYRDQISATLGEVERLQAILESLLLLARDAPGEVPRIDRRPVPVARLVAATFASLGVAAREREVALRSEVAPELQVPGEENLLRLLLFNLVDNAIRFSPAGGEVWVEALRTDGCVALRVRDHGPGVDPELRPRLFERFAAGPDGGERVGGLGLSFARWVAHRHGGTLELEDSIVSGSSFRVVLPGQRLAMVR